MATATTHAKEKGTFKIGVAFTNAAGAETEPTSATWTLTRGDGAVINDRLDETITPATSTTVTLSGDDLTLLDSNQSSETLVLTVEAVSATLPFKDEYLFVVDRMVGVS